MKKKNIWHDDDQPRGKSLTEFVETVWQDLQGVSANSLERPIKNLPTGFRHSTAVAKSKIKAREQSKRGKPPEEIDPF